MQKIEELRSKVNRLSIELRTIQENNQSLTEELAERNSEVAVIAMNESKVRISYFECFCFMYYDICSFSRMCSKKMRFFLLLITKKLLLKQL